MIPLVILIVIQAVRTKMPQEVREHHTLSENHAGEDILNVFEEFKQYILPYGSGNIHPGFFGWVQGGKILSL